MRRPDEGSVLDHRTLNRTLLARQHLLARVDAPVTAELEHLVGMQAQVPRDPYVGLFSRLRDFDPATLERLLLDRSAVRMTLMRTTLHLVAAGDAPLIRAAMQGVCERAFAGGPFRRRLDGIDLDAVRRAGVAIVDERPMTIAELGLALGERWPGADREALAYAVRYLEPLVQVTPRGLLRRSAAPRVTTLRAWLANDGSARRDAHGMVADTPSGEPTAPPPDRAVDVTVERYLRAFGPATTADIRAWSWLPGARDVVERLRPRLRSYRDGSGRELLDVEDGVFAGPGEPAPARFLGEYDNLFLAHADRLRVTGDLAWGEAYVRRGAFFVDGFLAGAWRFREPDRRIELEARRGLEPIEREELEAEALALGRFLAPDGAAPGLVWGSA